jgi:beta-lactam-binding protein with PASTA domain
VPDVRGLSAREATRRLTRFGLQARLQGDGFVATQDPPAGTLISEGAICHLTLTRVIAPHGADPSTE